MSIDFFPDFLGSATDEKILPDLAGDSEEVANVPCSVEKFWKTAELASALRIGSTDCNLQHVAVLAEESQDRDRALATHYRKIAAASAAKTNPPAPPASTSDTLAKRSKVVAGDPHDARKVARRETTHYSGGTSLVAEIAENGEVIRVIEEAA
jgi:hypothetical protein